MEHFDPFLDYIRTMLLVLGSWPGRTNMTVNISNQFGIGMEAAWDIVDSRVVIIPRTGVLTLLNKTMNEEESALYERYKNKAALLLQQQSSGTEETGEME